MLRDQLVVTAMIKWLIAGLVLLVLGGLAAWRMIGSQEEYLRENRVRIQLEMIASALKSYARRHGRFPSAEEGLNALAKEGDIKSSAFIDPWDHPVGYRCKAADCRVVVLSLRISANVDADFSVNVDGVSS